MFLLFQLILETNIDKLTLFGFARVFPRLFVYRCTFMYGAQYVDARAHIYIYIYIHIHIYIYIYIYMCMHTCIKKYTCAHTYIHLYVYIYVCLPTYTCLHADCETRMQAGQKTGSQAGRQRQKSRKAGRQAGRRSMTRRRAIRRASAPSEHVGRAARSVWLARSQLDFRCVSSLFVNVTAQTSHRCTCFVIIATREMAALLCCRACMQRNSYAVQVRPFVLLSNPVYWCFPYGRFVIVRHGQEWETQGERARET